MTSACSSCCRLNLSDLGCLHGCSAYAHNLSALHMATQQDDDSWDQIVCLSANRTRHWSERVRCAPVRRQKLQHWGMPAREGFLDTFTPMVLESLSVRTSAMSTSLYLRCRRNIWSSERCLYAMKACDPPISVKEIPQYLSNTLPKESRPDRLHSVSCFS